jgi:catechol 2,3-dioxygenase-like lactoylglutathione lyase family enzyme
MPELDAIGPVVTDLHRAVAFYRTLGVAFAEGAKESEHGHVEATLHSGMRLMLDTEAGILSFDPGWQRTSGSPGMALVIRCESPAAVDDIVQRPEHAGHGIHAVMVDDLDNLVAEIAQRGQEPAKRETYANGVRKITYVDPDGNEIAFGAVPR